MGRLRGSRRALGPECRLSLRERVRRPFAERKATFQRVSTRSCRLACFASVRTRGILVLEPLPQRRQRRLRLALKLDQRSALAQRPERRRPRPPAPRRQCQATLLLPQCPSPVSGVLQARQPHGRVLLLQQPHHRLLRRSGAQLAQGVHRRRPHLRDTSLFVASPSTAGTAAFRVGLANAGRQRPHGNHMPRPAPCPSTPSSTAWGGVLDHCGRASATRSAAPSRRGRPSPSSSAREAPVCPAPSRASIRRLACARTFASPSSASVSNGRRTRRRTSAAPASSPGGPASSRLSRASPARLGVYFRDRRGPTGDDGEALHQPAAARPRPRRPTGRPAQPRRPRRRGSSPPRRQPAPRRVLSFACGSQRFHQRTCCPAFRKRNAWAGPAADLGLLVAHGQ